MVEMQNRGDDFLDGGASTARMRNQEMKEAVGRAVKEIMVELQAASEAKEQILASTMKQFVEETIRGGAIEVVRTDINPEVVDRAKEREVGLTASPRANVSNSSRGINARRLAALDENGYPAAVQTRRDASVANGTREEINEGLMGASTSRGRVDERSAQNVLGVSDEQIAPTATQKSVPDVLAGRGSYRGTERYGVVGDRSAMYHGSGFPLTDCRFSGELEMQNTEIRNGRDGGTIRQPIMDSAVYRKKMVEPDSPFTDDIRGLGVKLPAFTGKESWEVWSNRFQDIADRRKWTDERRLSYIILPMLQGPAGEFVYGQLSKKIRGNYKLLIQELTNRFRKIETKKTFGPKFSHREQKPDETIEEFAADLKRLYDKAYLNRDETTRHEDLLRRFLDGLQDENASFHVEYVKEPETIDQAVYEVINFIETKHKPTATDGEYRKGRKSVRAARDDINEPENWEQHVAKANVKIQSQLPRKVIRVLPYQIYKSLERR